MNQLLPLNLKSETTAVDSLSITEVSPPAHAFVWTFNNVEFSNGGTLTGKFTYDSITNSVSNITITYCGATTLDIETITFEQEDMYLCNIEVNEGKLYAMCLHKSLESDFNLYLQFFPYIDVTKQKVFLASATRFMENDNSICVNSGNVKATAV